MSEETTTQKIKDFLKLNGSPYNPPSSLEFPSGLKNSNYYMNFYFSEYVAPGINDPAKTVVRSSVRLPIPANLINDTSVQYQQAKLGAAVGLAASESNNNGTAMITAGIAKSAASNPSIQNAISKLLPSKVSSVLGTAFSVAGGVSETASYVTGISLNPFLAMLFETPNFKKHNFSWKLIPNNQQESLIINKIIATFQANMLPTTNGWAFSYPSVVNLSLYANDPQSFYLYDFKTCVVEDFKVNYAPGNQPAFFSNSSAPAAIEISLGLTEISIWTKNDIIRA